MRRSIGLKKIVQNKNLLVKYLAKRGNDRKLALYVAEFLKVSDELLELIISSMTQYERFSYAKTCAWAEERHWMLPLILPKFSLDTSKKFVLSYSTIKKHTRSKYIERFFKWNGLSSKY